MFVDFRTLGEGSRIEADLCIIGAGAAGITIAREFVGTSVRVCLLESGGLEFDAETQALYEGETTGVAYFDLDACRLRYFGGTTNHWDGWCRPLNEIDFEAQPHVPYSGWPITRIDLDPFYERAHRLLEIGPYIYDERYWQEHQIRPPEFARDLLQIDYWRFSPPTRFGQAYLRDLEMSANIKVLTYANVTNVQANSTASAVEYVEVRSLTGLSGLVTAKHFVLACGGIENPRLLLLSSGVEARGLGNQHSLVGRFFMEHLETEVATVTSDIGDELHAVLDGRKATDTGVRVQPCLSTGRRLQLEKGILSCTITLQFRSRVWQRDVWAWHEGGIPMDYWNKVWRLVRDADHLPADAYGYFVQGRLPPSSISRISLDIVGEQAPNPDSRVTLSEDRDELGLNRARLEWRLTELERSSMAEFVKAIGREFGRLNLGRVKVEDWSIDSGWPVNLHGANHHMGTTRMADDPKRGVVNRQCRVHGVYNLYVAGSSVFPTCGSGVPTMSIVALALRLADHLKLQMG